MEIVVFGAGSLGSLIGGLLAHAGQEVTLVGRDPHVSAIRESGLDVEGETTFRVHPEGRTDSPTHADLAVVTVKAFDTAAAARKLAGVPDVTLSLTNGLGNESALARCLDGPVLAGTCTYGAVRPATGVVRCTGMGEVVLGPREGGSSDVADWVGELLAEGMATSVVADMPRQLWEKLAVNAAINAPTALARLSNGALLDGPGGEVAHAAAREAALLAQAEGVDLSVEEAIEAVDRVGEMTAANHSSMLQDIKGNRRTEIDAISGYIADRGQELGIETPVNTTLAALLRAWERDQGFCK
jgi:2-dehydropantoate 2-reductase